MRKPPTMKRRGVLTGIGALAAASLAGCSGGDGGSETTTEPDGPVVDVGPSGQFRFAPGTNEPLTVEAGTTVTWVWQSNTHNVVVESQPDGADWSGHEPFEDAGFSYEYTFEVPGEYHYYCQPHRSAGMVADVVVE